MAANSYVTSRSHSSAYAFILRYEKFLCGLRYISTVRGLDAEYIFRTGIDVIDFHNRLVFVFLCLYLKNKSIIALYE